MSPLPDISRARRRQSVLDAMAEAGIGRLVLASTGLHMIDLPNPLFHLTGFRSVGPAFAALGRDGTLDILVTPADDAERARDFFGMAVTSADAPMIADWPGFDGVDATAGFDALPHRLAARIAAPAFDDVFHRASAPKLGSEIAALARATEIAEAGYERLKAWARPGLRECDLAVQLNLFMKEQGADDSFLMLNAAPRADAVMPSSERPLAAGDLLLVELSPSVEGQFSQICRTVSLGEPPPRTAESYALLVAAMQAGIAQVRPGIELGAVCRAIDDHLSQAGFAEFSRPPFIRRRGHGLGAGSTYPHDVAIDNDTMLEAGMAFIVHPNQFLPATGYMMCGEPLVVGDAGAVVLSRRPSQLDVVAPC